MTLFLSRKRGRGGGGDGTGWDGMGWDYCYFQTVVGYEIGDEKWWRLRAINWRGG